MIISNTAFHNSLWLLLCQKIHPEHAESKPHFCVTLLWVCTACVRVSERAWLFLIMQYTVWKKKKVWMSEWELVRKTDIEKRVTAGIIPDCRFRILLHVSGWLWIIEEQQSQAQLYSLLWNIWKHNSDVPSCTDECKERDALYPLSKCIDYWALSILLI